MSSDLKVGDLMRKEIITVNKDATIRKVARLMKKYNVGSIIVVDKKNVIGIVTEGDIIHKALAGRKKDILDIKIKDIMTKNIKAVTPEVSIKRAAKEMKKLGVKRFPVINRKKELIGIISEWDITKVLPSIIDLIEEERYII